MIKKILFIALLLFIPLFSFANEHDLFKDKKVLILHSYHPQYIWTEQTTKGLKEKLEGLIPYENILIEYMDGRRFVDDPDYRNNIHDFFQYKFKRVFKPDVVVSFDDYAFRFLLDYRDELFGADTPVVFGGVNDFDYDLLQGKKNYTGVLEGESILENVLLIKKLHPNFDKILFLSDKTEMGQSFSQMATRVAKQQNIKFEIYDSFTLNELNEKITNLSRKTIPFMLAIHHDINGKYFSYDYDLPILNQLSSQPIYGMWGVLIKDGITGGFMTDGLVHGGEIGDYTLSILKGMNPNDLPIIERTKFTSQFNFDQITKYGINISALPKDSKIHDMPNSLYNTYRIEINIILIVITILLISNIILQWMVKIKTRKLEESNRRINDFVAIVAHDLRSPIGSIISYVDVLREVPEDLEEIADHLESSAKRSLELVNNILDISALETGKVKLDIKEMNLKDLFTKTLDEVDYLAKKKNIKLSTNLHKDIIVHGDFQRLSQVLQNLITNAIKFTSEDGEVKLNMMENNDKVDIIVKDNGIGIPSSLIPKIFNKNEKVTRPGTQGEQGTGYGLPLVYDLILQHGSELKVKSSENKGAEFHFHLPKAS